MCMIKIFRGRRGWWMGRWVAVKGAGGGGSLRDLSKNILKQGVGKGKNCVTTPVPPENFNHTLFLLISY